MTFKEYGFLVLGVLIVATVSYSFGRYTAKPSVKTETKVDQTETTNTHQEKIITQTKKPDGTVTTTTKIDTVKNEVEKTDSDTKSQVIAEKPTANLSALATIPTRTQAPTYGLSFFREVLGPITAGAFALNNGTIGVSIGLNF